MKYFSFILCFVVVVECKHMFAGTNHLRPRVFHTSAEYGSKVFQKRVENVYFALPGLPYGYPRTIQGVLAYDLTQSGATANITQGGIGFSYINIRMKSDRGARLHYDVYIFA